MVPIPYSHAILLVNPDSPDCACLFADHYGYATLKTEVKNNKGGRNIMDFMNRGGRPVQQNTQTQTHSPSGAPGPTRPTEQKSSKLKDKSKLVRIGQVGFLGVIALLVIAVLLLIVFSKGAGSREENFVKNDQFQAVFLNGGQVYFGSIRDLNSRYMKLDNIYYLRVNQQVQPDQQQSADANDISLVKLGCELHGPEDSMIINHEQIIFWENLKSDGQVAKAIAEYVKANPDGQNCEEQNGAAGAGANPGTGSTPATPNANNGGGANTDTPAPTAPATPGNNAPATNRP